MSTTGIAVIISDMDTGKVHTVHSPEQCTDWERPMYQELSKVDGGTHIVCGRTCFDWAPDGVNAWYEDQYLPSVTRQPMPTKG